MELEEEKCADLEQSEERGTISTDGSYVDASMDAMLAALACVVVDELISLKQKGRSPADVEKAYQPGTATKEEQK